MTRVRKHLLNPARIWLESRELYHREYDTATFFDQSAHLHSLENNMVFAVK